MYNPQEMNQHYSKLTYISSILVKTIQELSSSQSLDEITMAVRKAARDIVHADGATFVLREEEFCHYVDEDAISTLWKGMKFPLKACISGQCMINRSQIVIQDIYRDSRIPQDIYRPTFVKSLAMTPIRKDGPIGAIGTYWATSYTPTEEELDALQALADSTSIAINNVYSLNKIQKHVASLEKLNQQLNRYTWIVSHDLKEPLRSISLNFSLLEGELLEINKVQNGQDFIVNKYSKKIYSGLACCGDLIANLLEVAAVNNHENVIYNINLDEIVKNCCKMLDQSIREKKYKIEYGDLPNVRCDPVLLTRVFHNIISNSIKFQNPGVTAEIKIKATLDGPFWIISIQDNGIGIHSDHHQNIFNFFSHINNRDMYPGSGVGLSICKKIIEDYGGKIWPESALNKGCCMNFTLPRTINEIF